MYILTVYGKETEGAYSVVDDDGEDNPGAKAAAPVGDKAAQSDGSAQTSNISDAGDVGKQPTVGTDAAY